MSTLTDSIKNTVIKMLNEHKIGTLSTIRQNKPYSRFMLFFHVDLILYTATNKQTHKVEDIKENPNVHILLGYEGKGWQDAYVEIEGTSSIEESKELKERFWSQQLKEWINGADDSNYLLLKITPDSIRYYEKAGSEPQVLNL
ncbi:pyridoxamine 5'-phosphate oxidase family protein [Metabacillus herbersteinensis]|uniref:Pyridoxamine 5'-phosphate oxidase family protein n=1 Tax=Metabacillus herbersteinensis TaxID=283816 RepID=A0ABV6GIE5_9BACI